MVRARELIRCRRIGCSAPFCKWSFVEGIAQARRKQATFFSQRSFRMQSKGNQDLNGP